MQLGSGPTAWTPHCRHLQQGNTKKKTIDVLYKEGRGEAVFRTFLYDLNAWYIYIYPHII